MKLSANCKGGTKNFFLKLMIKSDSSYLKSKKKLISRKWKKEYYRLIDGIVRSYAVQRFFKGLFLPALLYCNGNLGNFTLFAKLNSKAYFEGKGTSSKAFPDLRQDSQVE